MREERDWLETPRTQDEINKIEERKEAEIENDFEEQKLRRRNKCKKCPFYRKKNGIEWCGLKG